MPPHDDYPLPPYPTGHKYYGPFVPETLTDGWCYGAITEFLDPDRPDGCDSGDGFVVAPDGSYCGLVWWRDCRWTIKRIGESKRPDCWGVFEVRFPIVVRSIADLVTNFRLILPRLQQRHRRRVDVRNAAPQFLGQSETTVLRLPTTVRLRASPAMFWEICCENPDLRLERTASGRLEVLPPAGAMTSSRNLALAGRLGLWNEATGLGAAFGSDLGYTLPNGAVRSADASWITQAQVGSLIPEQRERFVPFAPTFAAELRSHGDRLANLHRKMREYREQGTRLGWLIDLVRHRVEIYRADGSTEVRVNPTSVSGEEVLPGFDLDLSDILVDG